jgi:hypothetical protein
VRPKFCKPRLIAAGGDTGQAMALVDEVLQQDAKFVPALIYRG